MGTTPVYGLPYQGLSDPPHGPDLGQDLAEEVEVELTRIDARFTDGSISGSRIASTVQTGDSAGITTTTETSIGSVTASLVTGRIYRVRYVTRLSTSLADATCIVRIRLDTVAGTELVGDRYKLFNIGAAGNLAIAEGEYTATATGSKTFHLTLQRDTATATTFGREGSFMPTYIYVDYIRG